MPRTILDELTDRELLQICTNLELLAARLNEPEPVMAYVGFDPTADSLHVGHLMSLHVLRLWQSFGHPVVGLVGGFTGMVGDPSGKSKERNLLDVETLDRNRAALTEQITRLLATDGPAPTIVDNRWWFDEMSALEFLRDIGKLVSVSDMLERDSVRSRLAAGGLSLTEFTYQVLQAHDFAHLKATYGCEVQLGGSDQYGNITAGTDMIRRRGLGQAHGLVWPLLTKADGSKFGKTASGAIWLDRKRTSPFAFHQYWLNTPDSDVIGLLKRFTMLPLEEIDAIAVHHAASPAAREAQRALADEMTAWVHGHDEVVQAHRVAKALFEGIVERGDVEQIAGSIPSVALSSSELKAERLDRLAHRIGLFESVSAARRAIESGGVTVDGAKVVDPTARVSAPIGHAVVRHGARNPGLVVVKEDA